jgi:hypothetical protein
MRLGDGTPRWVVVQFENSPSGQPGALDEVYTRPFAAWLEADPQGRIVVRVGAEVLEDDIFVANHPVPGSFSDYVWVFDPQTGEVVSATFSGVFTYAIDWGFATTEIHAHVTAVMGTARQGGFLNPRSVWGRTLNPYCDDVESSRCTRVESSSYDRERGYVNAVGYITIDSPISQMATYSPLGEARFSELSSGIPATPPVAAVPAGSPVPGASRVISRAVAGPVRGVELSAAPAP